MSRLTKYLALCLVLFSGIMSSCSAAGGTTGITTATGPGPQAAVVTQDIVFPTSTAVGVPQQYLLRAEIHNEGGEGDVTVMASLYVLRQPAEAGKYATQYDARREHFRQGETRTVQFSFLALNGGLPFSGSIWVSGSLDDYYRYARTTPPTF